MSLIEEFQQVCPIPVTDYPRVILSHGSGGRIMQQMIEKIFYQAFGNPKLLERHDGAIINLQKDLALSSSHIGRVDSWVHEDADSRKEQHRQGVYIEINDAAEQRIDEEYAPQGPNCQHALAFTTDSYVIHPLFFPGGDIGSLAVTGTVNDLAMCGARPLYLSASFILEEGLPMETLWRIVQSMRKASKTANVQIITGDTKVVDKGKGDGIFINTAGIGIIEHDCHVSPGSVRAGDFVLLSGDIGRHGIAVMAIREGLNFETPVESDMAPLSDLVLSLFDAGVEVHCLRDATRGGLGAVLCEIAEATALQIDIDEAVIPVNEDVQGLCEILGLDPMYIANEGRFVAFIPEKDWKKALSVINRAPLGEQASLIGRVVEGHPGLVTIKTRIGGRRIVDMPSGEQLPRIC